MWGEVEGHSGGWGWTPGQRVGGGAGSENSRRVCVCSWLWGCVGHSGTAWSPGLLQGLLPSEHL